MKPQFHQQKRKNVKISLKRAKIWPLFYYWWLYLLEYVSFCNLKNRIPQSFDWDNSSSLVFMFCCQLKFFIFRHNFLSNNKSLREKKNSLQKRRENRLIIRRIDNEQFDFLQNCCLILFRTFFLCWKGAF